MGGHSSADGTLTGEHPVLPTGRVLADRYRIEALAGVGGMGAVYRARDLELGQTVALKLLHSPQAPDEETLQRFRRELLLGRQISHPNVVRVHDIGHDGGMYFLSMDYVEGRSLRELLDAEGPLPPERAATIAAQIASALAAAHARRIVHRDLKPSNILINAEGEALITDFGIARSVEEAGLTRSGQVFGTPDYLAPEQARGAAVDARADIYALGVMLYEMLSGRLPSEAESLAEKIAQRAAGRTRDIGETGARIPAWLRRVLRHCLAPNPAGRYQKAEDLADDLRTGRFRARSLRAYRLRRAAAGLLLTAGLALGVQQAWEHRASLLPGARPAAPELALAVLPFGNQTGDPALDWVDNGVPELLTAQLAEQPSLRVIDSLRAQRALRDLNLAADGPAPGELRLLAELLGADRLVTGRVRGAAAALDISLRLIDPATGEVARHFEFRGGTVGRMPEMTHDLARQIAQALDQDAPAAEPAQLRGDPEALRLYSTGLDRLLTGDSVSALPLLERAVQLDPGFAAGWLRLSGAYEALGHYEAALEAAREAIAQAAAPRSRIALEARARAAALEGEFARAEELLSALVAAYPRDTLARMALARSFGDAGEFARASAVLEEITAADPQHPTAWYLLGKYAILQGESRRAIDDYLVRALVIQNRLNNTQGRADVLNAMGIAYYDLGEFDNASNHYRKAIELRREIGDRRGVAATLGNLARIDALRGDYAAAGESLNEAMAILGELGDQAGVAALRNEYGILEEEQGRYREALVHYRAALRIRQDLGDKRALAESYNNVGYLYYLLGEYDNAGVYARQSLSLYRETENPEGEMLATQTIGELELARGDWEASLKAILHSLEAARRLDYPDAMAVAQGGVGRVAFHQGRYAAAAQAYREAFAHVEAIGDPRGMIEFTLLRTALQLELRRTEAAREALAQVERWLAEGGNMAQRAEFHRLRGRLAELDGDRTAAATEIAAALDAAKRSQARLTLLAAELEAAERPRAARAVQEEADRMGHVALRLEAREKLAALQTAGGDYAAAVATLREAIAIAAAHAPYHRLYRLQALLARNLEALGDRKAAAQAWQAAARAAGRLRENLDEAQRPAFDALPVVNEIAHHAP